jgi:multicomponent Na+:H+ antiporter subunit B
LKFFALIVVLITGALLIYATVDMPDWGDASSPANTHVSPRYLEEAVEKTATPNVVTAVLGDYRSYDTLGETTVIFTAGVVCILLLRRSRS